MYTIRASDGGEATLGDGQDAYWDLANAIDFAFEQAPAEPNPAGLRWTNPPDGHCFSALPKHGGYHVYPDPFGAELHVYGPGSSVPLRQIRCATLAAAKDLAGHIEAEAATVTGGDLRAAVAAHCGT